MNKKVNHQHLLWTALTPAGTNLTRWAVTLAVVMTCLFATTTEAWAQESGEEPQIRILTLGSGWNANGATVAASYLMGDETVEYTSADFSQEPAPVPEGSTVTLTITPGEGYLVDKVSVTKYEEPEIVGGIESRTRGTDGEASVEVSHADGTNVWSFTMPAYDVEVTVAYKKAPETQTETVTNPDGTETTTETIKETVTNPDGTETTTETIKETVTDKDGKVIQTKETIKKKVTNPDGTETTTENTKETVTNPDGTETTTEAITTTTTGADGSQTITTSKTPDLDVAIGPVKIDNDDNTNWHKIPTLKDVVISDNPDHVKLLIEQGHESNVLINSVTEKDAQGEVTASSASLTVKQNGSVDDGPTKIAINTGGGVNLNAPTSGKCGRYMTWVVSANAGSSVYDVLTISGSGQMDDMIGGSPWDAYQNQIKTVIIGERVTSIGIRAFSDCSAMTSLTFAEGSQLQTIGDYAFYGLTSLTSDIILPASVTSMGQGAFARVSKNTTVGISITAAEGSRLTAIHTDAFSYANASIDLSNCTLLEAIGSDLVFSQVTGDVTLPSSVTRICQYAFENEYSQPYPGKHVYITVPDGKKLKVTIAGVTDPVKVTPTNGKADIIGYLFDDSSKRIASRALTLKIVDASTGGEGGGDNGGGSENPDAPTSGTFGNFTWEVSKSDASSSVYDVLTISGSGQMDDMIGGSPWDAYQNQIKTVIIGERVTSIGLSAFSDCSAMTSLTFAEGSQLQTIGDYAFYGLTSLASDIILPASVTSIGDMAFNGCSSLTSVTIPQSVTSIGESAFSGCSSLTSVTIPPGVTSIDNMTFSGCSAMTSLTFAEGSQLQTISDYAFNGLTSLTSDITLPAGVTSIGNSAFGYVSGNTSAGIHITAAAGSQLTAIDTYAFSGANASIDLSNCTQLKAISKKLAFNSITGDVTLPSSVTRICQYAFENEYSQPYPGKHVYITVPDGKKLKVTIAGVTDPVKVTPTNGKADIIDYLFDDSSKRIASRALTLEIVEASTGDEVPSTREKNDRAATTMTVNYKTKKETGEDGRCMSKITIKRVHKSYALTRGATAEQEEDDEIEIVSGREYEILHDGYVVLNFYTPDAPITVNSIVFRRPGDANNDGYVNAVDLVEMINAKNGHASERFNLANADIDRDGTITQADIDAVVKMIMSPV